MSRSYKLSYSGERKTSLEIVLPSSKSISNRTLIVNALSEGEGALSNVAKCDDTDVMNSALSSPASDIVDIGAAGTSMRFLTAYYSITPGTRVLTGTKRMQERPIGILVDALRTIGANVEYVNNEGFPPLRITGASLDGGEISLDGSVSSQYVSALMMISPCLSKGLVINLTGEIASVPYILMTKSVMCTYGAEVDFDGRTIRIPHSIYKKCDYTIESDWSGASYWYECVAMGGMDKVLMKGLYGNSLQGDCVISDIFSSLGVKTEYVNEGVLLTSTGILPDRFDFDFTKCPDLAQTVVVFCAINGIAFRFTGLKSLRIKETDRISALINELSKLGCCLTVDDDCVLSFDGCVNKVNGTPSIDTYKDHRMAMAFAPVVFKGIDLIINEPEVVSKSFPGYWDELSKSNVLITEFLKRIIKIQSI